MVEYVIVGNSVAAIAAIEGIRKYDGEGSIKVISSEAYKAYGRPLITQYLNNELQEKELEYRSEEFYEKNSVELLLGHNVQTIDVQSKEVLLANRKRLSYQKLLIATGGIPFIPSIKGLEGKDIYSFVNLDDARALKKAAEKMDKAVVIGGGLIGLKAAESLHNIGVKVTIVELADRILSTSFDKEAAKIITDRLREVGLTIITEDTVEEVVQKEGRVRGVLLKKDRGLDCEAVVVAIGVIPNIEVVKNTSIEVNQGVVVNEYLETSETDIFAAGDVTEGFDYILGEKRVIPIWPNAYRQGLYAGMNMAGAKKILSGSISMNSIEFYGIPTISVGISNPPEESYEILKKSDFSHQTYRKLVLKRDVLVGALLVGNIERAGVLTGLIRDKIDVSAFKHSLLEEELGLILLPRNLREKRLSQKD